MLKEVNVTHKIVLSMLILGICFFVFQTIKCYNIRFPTVEDKLMEISFSAYRIIAATAMIIISEIIEILLLTKQKNQLVCKIFTGILIFLLAFGIFLMLIRLKTNYYILTYWNWYNIGQEVFDNLFSVISNFVVGIISILTSGAGLILLKIIGHYLKGRR